jgi:cyclic pyranopterin phosphate synthase
MDKYINKSSTKPYTLALLCGGESKRLGTDKGLHKPTGDETLVRRALRLFSSHFAEILLVVRDDAQFKLYDQEIHPTTWPDVRIVADAHAGSELPRCALSAVYSALTQARTDRIIALPIDQVGVSLSHLLRITEHNDSALSSAFVCEERIEPFPSIFSKLQSESLLAALNSKQLSVQLFHQEAGSKLVPADELTGSLAVNCNTPEEMTAFFGTPLSDAFDRRLHYLRFSLTEACNLSCTYCLPDGFPEWLRHKSTLNLDAIKNVLTAFRALGFRKVRFTGGEPTVHKKCIDAVRIARDLGFESIALTTNGLLIKNLKDWRAAGLSLLNVSLDSLDDDEFFKLTKNRGAKIVANLVDEACASGLEIKTNAVLLRSINGNEKSITNMIDWAIARPMTLRFIELMNTGLNLSFAKEERVLGSEIEPYLIARGFSLNHPDRNKISVAGPSTDYFSAQHLGKVGLINPMSCNFCDRCNRLRITAKGALKMCLFGNHDIPLDTSSPINIESAIRASIGKKPERHNLESGDSGNVSTFRTIGG